MAMAIAAMASLFGTSAMRIRSWSPKAYQPPTIFPPTASHALWPTASMRFCGFFNCAAQDSAV